MVFDFKMIIPCLLKNNLDRKIHVIFLKFESFFQPQLTTQKIDNKQKSLNFYVEAFLVISRTDGVSSKRILPILTKQASEN